MTSVSPNFGTWLLQLALRPQLMRPISPPQKQYAPHSFFFCPLPPWSFDLQSLSSDSRIFSERFLSCPPFLDMRCGERNDPLCIFLLLRYSSSSRPHLPPPVNLTEGPHRNGLLSSPEIVLGDRFPSPGMFPRMSLFNLPRKNLVLLRFAENKTRFSFFHFCVLPPLEGLSTS